MHYTHCAVWISKFSFAISSETLVRNVMSDTSKTPQARQRNRTSWIVETFKFPMLDKLGVLDCEASLEADLALRNLFDPEIIYMNSRPNSINSESLGQRYTPDLLVVRKNNTFKYYEVKPNYKLENPKNKHKFNALKKEFKEAGVKFEIVTEKDIHDGDLIENYKILFPYLTTTKPSAEAINCILNIVESNIGYTLSELTQASKCQSFSNRDIWYCLAHKILRTDLTQIITKDSVVWSHRDAV